jgi:hypothetical protein
MIDNGNGLMLCGSGSGFGFGFGSLRERAPAACFNSFNPTFNRRNSLIARETEPSQS